MVDHRETHAETGSALDYAREQGRLSGEVRVLKWAVGAAFVTLIATLGAIYTEMNQGFRDVNQQFRDVSRQFQDVNQQFQDVNRRIDQLTHSVADVRERLTRIEGRFDRFDSAYENTGRQPTLDSSVPPGSRGRDAS